MEKLRKILISNRNKAMRIRMFLRSLGKGKLGISNCAKRDGDAPQTCHGKERAIHGISIIRFMVPCSFVTQVGQSY
jgi:hypothetical protein